MKLRIIHTATSPGHHRVDLNLDDGGATAAGSEFSFSLTPEDQERLRWYWEDLLDYPADTAADEAAEVERRLSEIGEQLFQVLFGSGDAQAIWGRLKPQLGSARIEVSSAAVAAKASLPWELVRDPAGTVLSAAAACFVRVPPEAPSEGQPHAGGSPPLRVLVAMCRPLCEPGTPFRSPAAALLKSLVPEVRENVRIEVLRPPTFGQLNSVLLEAEATGDPYQVLHIDGYAVFADVGVEGTPELVEKHSREPQFSQVLPGPHGYLIFEGTTLDQNCHLIDGASLADLLKEARVPVLSLAAMLPADAELRSQPRDADFDSATTREAFHSLAYDAVSTGVGGAFCLPYAIDISEAAASLGAVYAALAQGQELGQAVTARRKQLHDRTERPVTGDAVSRQNWGVPVVHESEPLEVIAKAADSACSVPAEVLSKDYSRTAPLVEANLPAACLADFIGRDETLLAIDRAFDSRSLVLLEGQGGQGKTAAVVAFADWYTRTSEEPRPVLYTSFSYHKKLVGVLDQLAGTFSEALEKAGYKWAKLPSDERLEVALHTLNQIPVLWIWDNLEQVDATGGGSDREPHGQEQLANFLRLARETQAKFLLASRPTSHRWLGALPLRISLPGLPMRDRLQLGRILLERKAATLDNLEGWKAVAEFTEGNPLAVRCLTEHIVREGLETAAELHSLVDRLRTMPPSGEGKILPADAAVQHVLEEGISAGDRRVLALVHLFCDSVEARRLAAMGSGHESTALPELQSLPEFRELRSEDPSESTVLDRVASFGLLTSEEAGVYSIHATLKPFLARLFQHSFPARIKKEAKKRRFSFSFGNRQESLQSPAARAGRAYVRAMSDFGLEAFERFKNGDRSVIKELRLEEPNLHNGCVRARESEWWDLIPGCIHGLGALYESSGRIAEWSVFLDELTPECTEEGTQIALTGCETYWRAVTEGGVHLAIKRQSLPRAEELQKLCLQYDRGLIEEFIDVPPKELTARQRDAINRCALSLYRLGEIGRWQGEPELKLEEEAVELKQHLGDLRTASRWAFDLGLRYAEEVAVRSWVQAERWFQRSLELKDDEDRLGKSECHEQLGRVAWERFQEARKANRPQVELLRFLNDARQHYLRALENDPPDDWSRRAAHNQELGNICFSLGDLGRALPYYRESIRNYERHGNTATAAETQFTLALSLRDADRLAEARKFALEALENFEKLRDSNPEMISRTKRVVETIEQRLEAKKHSRFEARV